MDSYPFQDQEPSRYGESLIHLVPSKGDKPPIDSLLMDSRPQKPQSAPRSVLTPPESLPVDLVLPESWTQEERWNSLNSPGKPDRVATDIAVNGLILTFKDKPPPLVTWRTGTHVILSNIREKFRTSPRQIPFLMPFILEWVKEDIVTHNILEIPERVHISRLFHVPKDKDKIRPIIDLSFMNTFVVSPKFKMEHLRKTTKVLQSPSWAAKVDIQDAFLSVLISVFFQRFFCFWINDTMYMFKRMPFGLTTAPFIFTRLTRVIKKFLRRKGVSINSFIDDFLTWANTLERATLHLNWTQRVLRWLGFKINLKKTSPYPVQRLTYLGVDLDLQNLTMSLPSDKIDRLIAVSNLHTRATRVSRKDLEALIGLVTFSYSVIPIGRMYVTPLIVWMNSHTCVTARDAAVCVTPYLRKLLRPFCRRSFLSQKVCFKALVPDLVLMTDASDYGWSGVMLPYCVRDIWSDEDVLDYINEREMKAITYFMRFMHPILTGKHVVVHTDSMVVFFCLKKMGSLRSPTLNALIREFLCLCRDRNITFEVRHIPGKLNVLADAGSRETLSATDNCLDQETFLYASRMACLDSSIAVDLCATLVNTKCRFYVSPCPDQSQFCVGRDVRTVDWSQFSQIYLFPPVPILDSLLPKIEAYQGRALIIAPPIGHALAVLS